MEDDDRAEDAMSTTSSSEPWLVQRFPKRPFTLLASPGDVDSPFPSPFESFHELIVARAQREEGAPESPKELPLREVSIPLPAEDVKGKGRAMKGKGIKGGASNSPRKKRGRATIEDVEEEGAGSGSDLTDMEDEGSAVQDEDVEEEDEEDEGTTPSRGGGSDDEEYEEELKSDKKPAVDPCTCPYFVLSLFSFADQVRLFSRLRQRRHSQPPIVETQTDYSLNFRRDLRSGPLRNDCKGQKGKGIRGETQWEDKEGTGESEAGG